MNVRQALTSEKRFMNPTRGSSLLTTGDALTIELPGLRRRANEQVRHMLTIWVLVAQWLERLTGDQKVVGTIPVWGLEIVFLRLELYKRSSIIQDIP